MLRIAELRLPLAQADAPEAPLIALAARKLGVPDAAIASLSVFKRSFDARKAELLAVYIVDIALREPAQAAALLSIETVGVDLDDKSVFYFAGIDGARFKRPVEPGDQLVFDVMLDRAKAGIFKFKGQGKVGSELAVEAELMCTMRRVV